MNKTLNLIIIIGLLAIVIVAAFLGYQALTANRQADNFVTMPAATNAAPTGGEATPTADHDHSGDGHDHSGQGSELMPAPDFTVYDADGQPVTLSQMRGKPVIVSFWASWCGNCVNGMPALEQAYQTYGDDVHFMLINCTDGKKETLQTATAHIEKNNYTLPVYFDTTRDASIAYNAWSIPVMFLIDENGYHVATGQGTISVEDLEYGITTLLGVEKK